MTLTGKFRGALVGMGLSATAVTATISKLAQTHNELAKSMNASLAIMSGVTDAMRKKMVAAAIEVSETTRFASKDAAEAYFFLASAGLNAEQSLAAMPKVAAFAQAGNFDLALATDLATDAQTALGMSSKDAQENLAGLSKVTDVLIKANTIANASAQQFSESITNGFGAAMKQANVPLEDGVGLLAAFAQQGVKGAEAGTAASIVLRDLQTKAIQNAGAFRENNIAVFDWLGRLRRIPDVIQDIEQSLSGMSTQQQKVTLLNLGFSDKSVKYIQSVIGMSDAIRDYSKNLQSAGGFTEMVASKQMTAMEKAQARLRAVWERTAVAMGPTVDMAANWVAAMMDGNDQAAAAEGRLTGLTWATAKMADVVHTVKIAWLGLKEVFTRTLASIAAQLGTFENAVISVLERLGMKGGVTSPSQAFAEDLNRLADQQHNEFMDAFTARTPSELAAEALKKAFSESESKAPAVAAAVGDQVKSLIGGAFFRAGNLLAEGSNLAGGAIAGPAKDAAEMLRKLTGMGPASNQTLALARTGSVESYRQRRAIERQGRDPMIKVANQQLAVQKKMAAGIDRMAKKEPVMALNLAGG